MLIKVKKRFTIKIPLLGSGREGSLVGVVKSDFGGPGRVGVKLVDRQIATAVGVISHVTNIQCTIRRLSDIFPIPVF